MKRQMSRRTFTTSSVAAACSMTALQTTRALGANDRVRLGVIGAGNRGRQVMEGLFQFASGRLIAFAQYETSGNRALPRQAFAEFRGTEGALYVSDASYEVLPERGGRYQDDREPRMEPISKECGEGYVQHVRDHTRNFLDCLKTRDRPRADVEVGHRSTSMALLANIALATQSTIHWDPAREQITNIPEANDLLHYEYRKPWTLD